MAIIQFQKHAVYSENTANATYNFTSHTFKARLTAGIPDIESDEIAADLAAISSTGGYADLTLTVTFARTGFITVVTCDPIGWTPSGADFEEARGILIYDDTPSSPVDPIVVSYTFPTGIVLRDGVAWERTLNNTTGFLLLG